MKVARRIHINANDATPLSSVAPIETLPRASRVPIPFSQQLLRSLSRLAGGGGACHIRMTGVVYQDQGL